MADPVEADTFVAFKGAGNRDGFPGVLVVASELPARVQFLGCIEWCIEFALGGELLAHELS